MDLIDVIIFSLKNFWALSGSWYMNYIYRKASVRHTLLPSTNSIHKRMTKKIVLNIPDLAMQTMNPTSFGFKNMTNNKVDLLKFIEISKNDHVPDSFYRSLMNWQVVVALSIPKGRSLCKSSLRSMAFLISPSDTNLWFFIHAFFLVSKRRTRGTYHTIISFLYL